MPVALPDIPAPWTRLRGIRAVSSAPAPAAVPPPAEASPADTGREAATNDGQAAEASETGSIESDGPGAAGDGPDQEDAG